MTVVTVDVAALMAELIAACVNGAAVVEVRLTVLGVVGQVCAKPWEDKQARAFATANDGRLNARVARNSSRLKGGTNPCVQRAQVKT